MDLGRHLRFFVEVARFRHFGDAADALGITQPPLSQGIQRLERHWGCRLFDRSARRVDLTPAGEALLPLAHRALDAARDVEDAAARYAARSRHLGVGICPDAAPLCTGPLAALRADPSVPDLTPVVAPSDVLLGRLTAGLLDAAVVRYPAVLPGMGARAVYRAPTLLAVPDNAGDWRDLPVALTPRAGHPAAHDQQVDALARLGWAGEPVAVDGLPEAFALAACGAASALYPARLGAPPPGGLRTVELPGDPAPVRLALVARGDDPAGHLVAIRRAFDGGAWDAAQTAPGASS